ncbi:TRM11 family SAM-dependent methyltransferase [Salinibius halmophilus]|uniref:TRM11 family SAM-dependent methyltransferase n=1 Tax=Salinibius halmophilus TaxID=1853216 RepID=UPI000E66B704|nr:hypothetical protein [Salinibius halmophilus]
MNHCLILISPEAKQAYFADYQSVVEQEFAAVCPDAECQMVKRGPFEFLQVSQATEINPQTLLKLSFAQGLFTEHREQLTPVADEASFLLHEDFVFGSKYRGKTSERLTQLLINVGLAHIPTQNQTISLLDPMAGRGTSLFWAMRYGLKARGIEQDAKALDDIQRNTKKWTKLHKVKHKLSQGFIGKPNKQNQGKFLDFAAAETSLRVVTGDARKANELFSKEKFDLIVSDIPYGVQHTTEDNTRNPIEVIQQAIPAWQAVLKKHGVMVIAFNRNNPRRAFIEKTFTDAGMQVLEFSAGHRMSESIVRDVIVIKHG